MSESAAITAARVELDGKFFRLDGRRFRVRGVTYGSFAPNAAGEPFPEPVQAVADFALMRTLGANVVRTYHPPPRRLLDLAFDHGLRVLTDLAWPANRCFLDTAPDRRLARLAVAKAVGAVAGHPALFAVSLANEIPPDVVRWSGPRRLGRFLDDLVPLVRDLDPGALVTFGSFPPTEYLQPAATDFVTFNVYLHDPPVLEAYLARLQMIADTRPLLLGEFGADALREGAARQAEIVGEAARAAFRAGLAGAVAFQFTDDWHRNGAPVLDWELGLTTRERAPKPAFGALQRAFAEADAPAAQPQPLVSVVVACRNGARTLRGCLASLEQLRYPNRELILVDDGSEDATPRIAEEFPGIRYFRQPPHGLSVARNVGIGAARGEIVAFTDDDCRVDPEWLDFLVADLQRGPYAGIGGHNLLPPDDSPVAAAVMASPGGPAHVMLDDRLAEHLPGCNMAFLRAALLEVGGFDPQFTRAGDDVDVCWRLLGRGFRLAFSPGGFVWHHRRSTVKAYLRQQSGYGEAEALLVRKHPECFNAIGGMLWRGRIYAAGAGPAGRAIIYHGRFGAGMFQTLYSAGTSGVAQLVTSLEYWVFVALPLVVAAQFLRGLAWPAVLAVLTPVAFAAVAGVRASLPAGLRRWWSRPLVAALFLAQPVARGAARYFGLFQAGLGEPGRRRLDSEARLQAGAPLRGRAYWSAAWRDRLEWIARLSAALKQAGWEHRVDTGWGDHDLEVLGDAWTRVQLTTVAEANHDASQTLRARLCARWTLLGAGLFWGLLVTLLVALGTLPFTAGWMLWGGAAGLQGAAAWFLHRRARRHLAEVGVVLDEASAAWGLKTLGAQPATKPSPAPAPVTPAVAA